MKKFLVVLFTLMAITLSYAQVRDLNVNLTIEPVADANVVGYWLYSWSGPISDTTNCQLVENADWHDVTGLRIDTLAQSASTISASFVSPGDGQQLKVALVAIGSNPEIDYGLMATSPFITKLKTLDKPTIQIQMQWRN